MMSRLAKVQEILAARDEPAFRFKQVTQAIFKKRVARWQDATAVPKSVRDAIQSQLGETVLTIRPIHQQQSAQANKVLFELPDGNRIETVLMRYWRGQLALCISSQAGCAMGCSFCATGKIGLKRNLTADGIVDQVLYFLQQGLQIQSISFMGMGEPLNNPHIFEALNLLLHQDYLGISQRRLSISTIGIVPGIQRLTEKYPSVNLAFSLHSPFTEQRNQLVPLNKAFAIEQVLKTLDHHVNATRRKVFIAYLLLDGYNDSPEHAAAIIDLLKARTPLTHLYHVNLLRYNPARGIDDAYKHTNEEKLKRFASLLRAGGLNVTARQSFGLDIDAACGQLFARYEGTRR